MDTQTLIRLRQRSNILVTEQGQEQAAIARIQDKVSLWSNLLLPDIVPILKALVIVTLFLISGLGYTPLGCKTQYLFSDKYWYNKQLVIFFIIYFIINIRGEAVSNLTNPLQEFALSIGTWLAFNMIARMSNVWLSKTPWYWPGPLTWFGAVALPLISMYILDDMRRYFIAEHALKDSTKKIEAIRNVEMGLIGSVALILIIGFIKAVGIERQLVGKNFQFIPFFFGAPQGNQHQKLAADRCTPATLSALDRSISKLEAGEPHRRSRALGFIGMLIVLVLGGGYLLPSYREIAEYFNKGISRLTKSKKTFIPNTTITSKWPGDYLHTYLKASQAPEKYKFQYI